MKGFFNSLALSFAIVGSIIGAGFITGAEIVTFFFIKQTVALLRNFVCFAICFSCVFNVGRKPIRKPNYGKFACFRAFFLFF